MTGTHTNVSAPRDTKLILMENVSMTALNTHLGKMSGTNVCAMMDMNGNMTDVRRKLTSGESFE